MHFPTVVTAQTKWFKYRENPVLQVGAPGTWEAGQIFAPRVLRVRDTLRMWYTGNSETSIDCIGYAWSTDEGFTWSKYPSNPVMRASQPWELGWTFAPYVIHSGETYRMWYTGGEHQGALGYATSRDGIQWNKYSANPVLDHGPSAWDARRIEWPCIMEDRTSGDLMMWYAGYDQSVEYQIHIGYATGTDDTTWTKNEQFNPVLIAGPPGAWDYYRIKYPRVLYDGQLFRMWYSGGSRQFIHHNIGHATSTDGVRWSKYPGNPVVTGEPTAWDGQGLNTPDVHFDGKLYRMWYAGYDGTYSQIGVAVSPSGFETDFSHTNAYVGPHEMVHLGVKVGNAPEYLFTAIVHSLDSGSQSGGVESFSASIDLHDDGKHGDGAKGDGYFANDWSPVAESTYTVDLALKMRSSGRHIFEMKKATLFTGIGPITLEDVEVVGNAQPGPGDSVRVRFTLKNNGTRSVASSISARVSAVDTLLAAALVGSSWYGDIPPGGQAISSDFYSLYVNPDAEAGQEVKFRLHIASQGHDLWYATYGLRIVPPWWQSRWAYGLYAAVFLGLLYGIRRVDLRRVRQKHQREMELFQLEQLKAVDQMKSRFFANISHEFRTPLTLIQGPLLDMLASESGDEARERFRLMLRNCDRLLTLVNQLLDLSRVESGQLRLHPESLDLGKIARELAASFDSHAMQRGITFTVVTPPEPLYAWLDRDATEKIISNLLSNAFKFTLPGGCVRMEARRASEAPDCPLELVVTDTGRGIPRDQLDRVFDRFYQVDAAQMHEHEGTGIGLALTKELAELQNGRIWATSNVGIGSTFTVRFPDDPGGAAIDRYETAEPSQLLPSAEFRAASQFEIDVEAASKNDSEGGLRADIPLLLVIEDNEDMRRYIRTHVEADYAVMMVEHGEEGVRIATERIPDLVITDVMMPGMDGFKVCERLKTDERTSHIPVILLTARARMEDKIEGLETGADDYLVKPFDAKELQARIRNLIDQRRRLREKFAKRTLFQPSDVTVTSMEEKFLNKALAVAENHISDHHFSTEVFAREMFLSRMQLHRKIKALTDRSPWEFIRVIRLERAAILLKKRAGNIADIAYQVGYENPSHFTEAFRRHFGVPPSEYEETGG